MEKSANEGPNARVSDLAADVLNKAADTENSEFECPSTEALQAKVEALNRRLVNEAFETDGPLDKRKMIVGSLDFKAWYPSLKKDVVVPALRKRLEEGPATINVDEVELARLLFILMEEEEIATQGLEDVIHTMKNPNDRKPKLTDQEIVGGDDFRTGLKSKLNPPKEKPNVFQKRRMVAIAMSLIVEKVMTNFLYTFGGEDRKQASGGPIGDVLTQAIARHMGNEFDERFNQLMTKVEVKSELYQRYADDIDVVVRSVGRTKRFCPLAGSFVEKTEEEMVAQAEKEEDEITMLEMKNMADTIMQNIETEFDCPSAHPELNNKVPVLDLAMWVEEILLAAQGLEEGMHTNCKGGEPCLPIGTPPCATPAYRGRSPGPNIVQIVPVLTPQPGSQAQQHQNLQPVDHPSSGKQTTAQCVD